MQGNPVDLNRLMWLGAGAGSKGIVAGMVAGFAPQAGITPEIASGAIGFWLAGQGGARLGAFGEGMLIAAIGQLVRQPIEAIFGQIGKPTPPEEEKAPQGGAGAALSPEEALILSKYGIVLS